MEFQYTQTKHKNENIKNQSEESLKAYVEVTSTSNRTETEKLLL